MCTMRGGGREEDERVVLVGEDGATSTESGGEAKLFAEGEGASGRDRLPHAGATKQRRRGDGGETHGSGKGKVVVRLVVLVSTA